MRRLWRAPAAAVVAVLEGPVVIAADAPAGAVLSALAATGNEWRESLQPAPLRSLGYYRLHVEVRGARFRMYGVRMSQDPFSVTLSGEVRPVGSGSEVVARFGVPRRAVPGAAIALLALTIGIAWATGAGVVLVLAGVAVVGGLFVASRRRAFRGRFTTGSRAVAVAGRRRCGHPL